MDKLSKEQLKIILNADVVSRQGCIEMNFSIDHCQKYNDCYLGKMLDSTDYEKEIYWFGLVTDGTETYSYISLTDMLNDKVFFGKSLLEILENIIWESLDGCSVEEMLPYYCDGKAPLRSNPK